MLVLIKLAKFAVALRCGCGCVAALWWRCGCVAVPVNCFFDIISSFFAKFNNFVHSLEPGETPSNSAFHQAPNCVQNS